MKRTTLILLMLGIGVFLVFGGLVGCDNASQSSASTNSTVSTTSKTSSAPTKQLGPTPTHIAINTVSQRIVTLADNNHIITVKPGTTIKLMLNDTAYSRWLVSISQSSVLIPWANAPMPQHVQGIFNAGPSGSAQITATGQASCASTASSCSKGVQHFLVQIKIG
jgi:predicted secreted protein